MVDTHNIVLTLTHCTCTDEGWHQAEECWQVAVEETDPQEDCGEGNVSIGTWSTDLLLLHHMLRRDMRRRLSYHHHIL